MNKRSNSSGAFVALVLAAAAAGIAAYRKRPVKPPERSGTWQPVENSRTRRR